MGNTILTLQIDVDLLAVGISKAGKMVLPPTIFYDYNTLDNFAKKCYKGDSIALKESEIGKVYTCETFMSQNCPENQNETPEIVTSYKVAGVKDATQFTVSDGKTAVATIKKGDQLIVNGYLYTVIEEVAKLQDFPFWITCYGANNGQMPADEYGRAKLSGVKAWQYTSIGSRDGVNGNVDLDVSFEDLTVGGAALVASDVPTYEVGKTYTLQVELKVRTGAGTNYPAKTHSQISVDVRKHDADKDGVPDKATVATCKEVAHVGDDVWI